MVSKPFPGTIRLHWKGRMRACGGVRELCPGEQTVFQLSQNPATTGRAALD